MNMMMSPGVTEIESTTQLSVVRASNGRGALVGKFNWGPAFERVKIADELELLDQFGTPDNSTADYFLSAANFLSYANDLRTVRVINEKAARNASPIAGTIVANITNPGSNYTVGDKLVVKYAGQEVEKAGKVTKVDESGQIEEVFIPSEAIIARSKAVGTFPELDFGWSVEIDGGSSGISGAIKLVEVTTDSGITLLNSESSVDVINGKEFQDLCKAHGIPAVAAAYPGEYGDGFRVMIVSKAAYDEGTVELPIFPNGGTELVPVRSLFQYGPQTEDQYGIVVTRNGIQQDSYILSTKRGDRDIYNENLFMDDFFANGHSNSIFMTSKGFPKGFSGILHLAGGLSANNLVTEAELMLGWDLFADREIVEVNGLIAGACAGEGTLVASTVQKHVAAIASQRADCEAYISPPRDLLVNVNLVTATKNLVDWRTAKNKSSDANMNISTTYAFIDGNYKYQYDKYNGVYRWVPLAADIAGLAARTDAIARPWMSPAGYNRGQIRNCTKLAIEPRQSHRDDLYQVSINPVIVDTEGRGFVLFGDKTATSTPSPFDRLNVRRLFNYVKRTISATAKYRLWENNDEFTRSSFRTETDGFLTGIKDLGGVYDKRVVCDTTNNTPAIIDANEFVATFQLKPARSINFITLNYVATSTGANFDELVSSTGTVVN